MKRVLVLIGAMPFACAVCAQTNAPAPLDWFVLPSPTLKASAVVIEPKSHRTSDFAGGATRTVSMPDTAEVRLSLLRERKGPEETIAFPGADPESVSDATREPSATNDLTQIPGEEFSIRMAEADFDARLHERFLEGGYLTRAAGPSDNLLVRAADGIFTPEVFQLRKVAVSCSILTAIKRKNPLCLLSPIFLTVDW